MNKNSIFENLDVNLNNIKGDTKLVPWLIIN